LNGHRTRILVVEDESMNRALLRATLARAPEPMRGAELLEAETIAAARRFIRDGRVDIVLLDIRLPDGSGLDLARELVDMNGARPRIVVLSASVMPEERASALSAGCDAFLPKPYRPADLVELIGTLLASSRE
jgi:CheY-like chemotaxis protein